MLGGVLSQSAENLLQGMWVNPTVYVTLVYFLLHFANELSIYVHREIYR